MRNLLGRLHARSAADLERIAAFWRVAPVRGDRHAQVGAVYRAMIDPAAARDAWERLDPGARELARALVSGEVASPATLGEIAAGLGVPEGEARETAASLWRHGILAREGDGAELAMGEAPRVFLPREIALQFRRVLDEIDLGDRSATPLRTLVAWLDDGELDEAAAAWGSSGLPGGRQRKDVEAWLLRQAGDPARLDRAALGLSPDARRVWAAVSGHDGPMPLAAARAASGLDGDDPRTAARWRAALAELERSLLAWHTYRPDGSRWLFVPAEIRNPAPPPDAPLPPLAAVADAEVGETAWVHPQAAAWDLLTVLRELASQPWPAEGDVPRSRLRRLNARLWRKGPDLPPPGYLPFLIAVAASEGLVESAGGERPALAVTPAVRQWRDRSFPEQAARVRWWWRNAREWLEGKDAGRVELWGVDWPAARGRLLAALADPRIGLQGGLWHSLDSVALRIAAAEPDLLGAAFTAATARLAGEIGEGVGEEAARAAATAEAVAVELETALAWLGLVETADVPGRTRAVRLTGLGDEIARGGTPIEPDAETAAGPALEVDADGAIRLLRASPLRVWALTAFAEQEVLGPVAAYRVDAASLGRALGSGWDASQVTGFLRRQAGGPIPGELEARIGEWARAFRRVRVRRAWLATPDEASDTALLREIAAANGWETREAGEGALVLLVPGDDDREEAVLAALREAGCSPLADAPAAPERARGKG